MNPIRIEDLWKVGAALAAGAEPPPVLARGADDPHWIELLRHHGLLAALHTEYAVRNGFVPTSPLDEAARAASKFALRRNLQIAEQLGWLSENP